MRSIRWVLVLSFLAGVGFASPKSYLKVPSKLIVPVGEVRTVPFLGKYGPSATIWVENPTVCDLVSTKTPFAVKGLRPGKTKIDISSGKFSESTQVTVMEHAGLIPKEASLVVTGDNVSAFLLRSELAEALDHKIIRKDGTHLQLNVFQDELPAGLTPGEALHFPVKTQISGKNYISSKGIIKVNIENQALVLKNSSHLMMSNNPESFTHSGVLFKEQFPEDSGVRLFYHHYNKGKVPYWFEVNMINLSSDLAKVHVSDGTAGPDPRELSVGAGAGERFFSALKHKLGRVVEVNAERQFRLILKKVNPGECVSGIVRLSLLNNARPVVETRVRSLKNEEAPSEEIAEKEAKKSNGIFEGPQITLNSEYLVGGNYTFIPIGKGLLVRDLQTAQPDLGNYGVLYTIHLTLNNPTSSPATAHILFSPQAGPAKGIFFVDGKLLKTPVVSAFDPYPLLKVDLASGEVRNVELQTMPLGGSFYPVQLIAQP